MQNSTPIMAHPFPGDHDFCKFKFTQPKDPSSQVTSFLADWFLRRRFLNTFLNIFLCKNVTPPPQLFVPPYSRDHDLNKPKSTLPKNASTQVTAFLTDWFSEKIFFYIFLRINSTPHCGPALPPGIRLFSHKLQLFWQIAF